MTENVDNTLSHDTDDDCTSVANQFICKQLRQACELEPRHIT